MAPDAEKKEEVLYRADPFTFLFRELDLLHADVREIKTELADFRHDVNKRFDDVHKRFDRLYLLVILNLMGMIGFLAKTFLF